MTLLKRIGYYLGGFSVGLIILAIFLKKKNTEFCYGIDCRILKNIKSKSMVYSEKVTSSIYALDSISIRNILNDADVNMSKSDTTLDSCKVYFVEGTHNEQPIYLTIENCDKTATIQSVTSEE